MTLNERIDLTTEYLGLRLPNPLVVSACPLTGDPESLQRLEEAGAAAAVLPSLFEEQIEHEEAEIARLYDYQSEAHAESLSYFPEMQHYNVGPEHHLFLLKEAKQVVKMPIIASLNGSSKGGWIRYAHLMQEEGADAIELNIYFVPTDAHLEPMQVEQQYYDLVAAVRDSIKIPLTVKIGPYFTNTAYTARRLVESGANGLVMFNRYLHPDVDIEDLQIEPKLVLSSRHELWQSLRWIAIVRDQVDASLAANSGIHTAADVIKALLVGADVAMLASSLIKYGPQHLSKLLDEVTDWMREKEYDSVQQLKGSMDRGSCPDPSMLERANYTKALVSYTDEHFH